MSGYSAHFSSSAFLSLSDSRIQPYPGDLFSAGMGVKLRAANYPVCIVLPNERGAAAQGFSLSAAIPYVPEHHCPETISGQRLIILTSETHATWSTGTGRAGIRRVTYLVSRCNVGEIESRHWEGDAA
jgi:hypothetical protein